MKDDFLLKKIIIYGIGVMVICLWAVFRILPYNISMYLATAVFICSLFMEARMDQQNEHKKKAVKKYSLCLFITICFILILLMNP